MGTVSIDKFLGLRLDSSGDLTLQQGELSRIKNCKITENYKLRKRDGYDEIFASGSGGAIKGDWYGKIGSSYKYVFARDGHVYEGNLTTKVTTDLGTLTNARTFFFAFNDALYMQNANEYKKWTGTGSISTVDGYVPKIAIGCPPSGGGTPFEDINTLTGKKHQTFNGNASASSYQLAETSLTSIDSVYVNGVLKTLTTDYTVNLTNGTVSPVVPANFTVGLNNIDIYWTKGTGTRTTVTANKQSVLFGGANDSRVFMYGSENKVIYSALANGVPSAEYFPENNYLLVGSDEYAVTALSKQYDRLIHHKENDSYYSVYEYDATLGTSFPTYPLNDVVGNIAFGQSRTVLNNPYVLTNKGVYQFVSTNVRDERNADPLSARVQVGLDALDLSTAITMDWEKNYEFWVAVGNKIYIYNYDNNTWYYYELADTPTTFIEINGECYFGTSTGKIMKFGTNYLDDNGTVINVEWELGFMDFGANYIRKFLNFVWIGMQPQSRSLCNISWESDVNVSASDYIVSYNLMGFGNVDFGDFSFSTNYTPQPFRLKLKAKKFTYLKIKGASSVNKKMTILNITLPSILGGMSK